jgi:hypothetical protein
MSYQYDIFISYRRNEETCSWIRRHFVPLLELRVELELGRKPEIYVDSQIESGTSWPASLGAALGGSRVLIALWSRNYLASVWCTEELSHMLAREREAKLRTIDRPHGIVIPAFVHDGETFPSDLGHIQHFEVQNCFWPRMPRNCAHADKLDAVLADQAKAIANCITNAPAWRKAWPQQAAAEFFKKFRLQAAEAVQKTVPRFTGP